MVLVPSIVFLLYPYDENKIQSGKCDFNTPINSTGSIPWKKDSFLSFADYKGVPDYNSSYALCTYTYVRPTKVFVDNDTDDSKFHITNVTVTAYFRPYDSWVKPEVYQSDLENQELLLKHEQGVFDLAEVYAKKLESYIMSDMKGKKFSLDSSDKKILESEVQKILLTIAKKDIDKISSDYHLVVSEYEYDTDYGRNATGQSKYNLIFDELRSNDTKR